MKAVILDKPHTHAGVDHQPGATITVAAGTADYLENTGIGRKVSAKAAPAPFKQPQTTKRKNKGGSIS